MLNSLLLTFGLIALGFSVDVLVRGTSGLARSFGIPSLVAGVTIVAFVTGAPQLVLSLQSSMAGASQLAIGTVLGSSIFDILVVLALVASATPLVGMRTFVRLEVPAVIFASMALAFVAADGRIDLTDGVALIAGLGVLTVFLIRYSLRDQKELEQPPALESAEQWDRRWHKYGRVHRIIYDLCLVAFGVILLVLAIDWLTGAAKVLGFDLGLSETISSLTIFGVCLGLPGAFTSVLAALRYEPELAVGTILGNCAFSILGALGLSAVLAPNGLAVPTAYLGFDMPMLLAATIACLPLAFISNRIEPWHAAALFAFYIGYVLYLVMNAEAHDASQTSGIALIAFVLPITVLTVAVIVWRKLWAVTEAEA